MESDSAHSSENDDVLIEDDADSMDQEKLNEYFTSYENLDVHRLMLEDEVRTKCYEKIILSSQEYFNGKVVMDVGAGTGILSLICAKAGAKQVYAVEASNLALILKEVFSANGFSEVIQVCHSKVEDLILDEKVDIIVSEWMGFYLLHESMLESVIFARDKFLKKDGHIFPESAQIFAAPIKFPTLWERQIGFWEKKQYSFDFSPMSKIARNQIKPEIHVVPPDSLLSEPQRLWEFNLKTICIEDLKALCDRRFLSIDIIDEGETEMHGVCVWFSCKFPNPANITIDQGDLELSTAPWNLETHWKQTVILFPSPLKIGIGEIIGWKFLIEKESLEIGSRSYKLSLELLGEDEEHPVPCFCGSAKCEIIKHYISSHKINENGDLSNDNELK